MTEKVLLVDDDTVMLSVVQHQLSRRFDIFTATSGEEALEAIESRGPFAVVVCDKRLPGMDGVVVLGKIREMAPDTVRIMLTGHADLQTAMDSINKGNIFRFLTKPCPPKHLARGIEAGLQQYRLLTAERTLLERTRHMATHDGLTGLPNRELLMDRLEQALARARRNDTMVALMYIDLDDFKPVNDTMGHNAGDVVLKGVSERLRSCLREMDTVARIGGDEFIVILTDVANRGIVSKMANKISKALTKPYRIGRNEASIGASIGIALYPLNAQQPGDMLIAADKAMYAAKDKGKGNYQYA